MNNGTPRERAVSNFLAVQSIAGDHAPMGPDTSPDTASIDPPSPCACGRGAGTTQLLAYAECCGRYVDYFEECPAPDPESLMRSRYTAFVRAEAAYLLATWHPRTRPANVTQPRDLQWLGLEVQRVTKIDATRAEVQFRARFSRSGRSGLLQERSRFVQEDGRWYYVDGDVR